MRTYLYDYFYNGSRWNLEITALSKEDADNILKTLPLANYVGILQCRIPAFPKSKWLANLIVWWKNFTSKNPDGFT